MITTENLKSFDNLIENEIALYGRLKELYIQKKQTLISNNMQELLAVDDAILNLLDEIKSMANHRQKFCKSIGKNNVCLSEIIKMAEDLDATLVDGFKVKQSRIKDLQEEIDRQESSSKELIKHGMIMVTKTMNLMSSTALVAGDYNNFGKNTQSELAKISSVSEEG